MNKPFKHKPLSLIKRHYKRIDRWGRNQDNETPWRIAQRDIVAISGKTQTVELRENYYR